MVIFPTRRRSLPPSGWRAPLTALLALLWLVGCSPEGGGGGAGDAGARIDGGGGAGGGGAGDGGPPDAALSAEPEWMTFSAGEGISLVALAATAEGVFALGHTPQRQAQLFAFDGEGLAPVGAPAAQALDHLAGRSADGLYGTTRFSAGRAGALLFRFDGGRWVEQRLGDLILAEVGSVDEVAVGADGLVWLASSGGLVRVEGGQYRRFSYQEDRFEFAETFLTVATPPGGGRPLAASERGSYRVNPDGSASGWDLKAVRVALAAEDRGFAVTGDPPGFAWLAGETWSPQAAEDLSPRDARIALSPEGTAWVLEQTPEGPAPNRLWRVTPEGAAPFPLPEGAPRLRDVLARADADLWLAGEDGSVWRFVAPAAAREGRVILPEPPPAPVVAAVPLPEGVEPANFVALEGGGLLVIGRSSAPARLEALVYDGVGFSPHGGAAPLSGPDLSGFAREASGLSAAGDELAGLVEGGGGTNGQRVVWWRPGVGSVRSEGRYSAAALVAPGALWAIRDGVLGRLEGEALEWVPDPDAPSARSAVSRATLAGGAGELWMHSNGTIHSRIDGIWTAYPVGQLSAIHSLAWTGPGQVIAGGQNGNVFEVRAGEVRPHTGLTNLDIGGVYGAGDHLYVRFRGSFLGFDGRSWGEVSFPELADVAWNMVRGTAGGARYYRGVGPAGPVLLQVSPPRAP